MIPNARPVARRFSLCDISQALRDGWSSFSAMPLVSLTLGALIAAIGLVVLSAAYRIGVAAMALPLAGGFMLLGPILLSGFFRLVEIRDGGGRPRARDAFAAFLHAPRGLWIVALVCAFLFMIWITDAGILYSFTIGRHGITQTPLWLEQLQDDALGFTLWSSLMGSVLAFFAFALSAFSVPLLHQRRATLVQAVYASVCVVLRYFPVSIAWGLLLAGVIIASVVLLPLLTVSLPVMAYASFALYRRVFPPA